jgi:N-acetylneuraminate epimerase
MKYFIYLFFLSFMLVTTSGHAQITSKSSLFKWDQLPVLPDQFGFAGSFSGVSGGALIVAGGANFPDGGAPWTGSKKAWTDKIFVLDQPNGKWKIAGKLPKNLGYGVSVSFNNQLICIGGSNEDGHSAVVFSILYDGKTIKIEQLPDLPKPLANATGAVSGNVVYIAGGLFAPDSEQTANIFWSFDLSIKNSHWKSLETWPGASRMLSVSGVAGKSFYLFSGTDLIKNASGQLERQYLNDAFCYTPGKGWKKIADLPHAVVAAPSPAYTLKNNSLLVFGGDDGKLAATASSLKSKHPGFSDEILSYNPLLNKWLKSGNILRKINSDADVNPNGSIWPAVTNSMVLWKNNLVFPGGEVRPAVRTPRVIIARPNQ